ncbi:phage tail sheath C-terminal domain-containing protein [Paraburkholderia xenovorans]|uniref:phage tail sheath family protein n=1 Tax=Paraburkholderia xenovorans TaxID=36873 RepID=UPI0038B8899A
MTIEVSYPGVYVVEDASPIISINTLPTAVPIIGRYNTGYSVERYENYLDVVADFGSDDQVVKDARHLKAYFECGGGPCYSTSHANVLAVVSHYDDITLIVGGGSSASDINTSNVRDLCAPGTGRFAILDCVPSAGAFAAGTANQDYVSQSGAAVYYPALNVDWPGYETKDIPASVIMAALYCVSDRTRGVWKAPANIALPSNYTLQDRVTDDLQGLYNSGAAINMIRSFNDRGTLVWGARTLEDSSDWRYISVRRLFNSAERDIGLAVQKLVFEPNNAPTWEKLRHAATSYLSRLWTAGALMGDTEKDAYFVQIGEGETMTSDDIAQGKMIMTVGMAAVRPAEFIILQFTQNMAA